MLMDNLSVKVVSTRYARWYLEWKELDSDAYNETFHLHGTLIYNAYACIFKKQHFVKSDYDSDYLQNLTNTL